MNGTTEDINIIRTFENKSGLTTVIVEVTPGMFGQLRQKDRIFLDWSSFPFEENLYVPFCQKCCRYGRLPQWCNVAQRCMECGGESMGMNCGEGSHHCLPCTEHSDHSRGNINHPSRSGNCPTYLSQLEKLQEKITYK